MTIGKMHFSMYLPLDLGFSLQCTEWSFQGMLLIIGGRYLTFASIYSKRLFWILGAILGIAAYLLFSAKAQPFISTLTGSIIKITFGLFMLISFKGQPK